MPILLISWILGIIVATNGILSKKDGDRADQRSRANKELLKVADPHEVNWTHCNAVLLYYEPESQEHTIQNRMAPGHESKRFTILGFGYVS